MAESIVKVPSTASGDYDFLGFSFAGKHSWDDFGLIRTSDGDRYNENLAPTMNDKTAEVPGGDGIYYFGTTHKQRDFNVSFAFENMTEAKFAEMKKWLNGKEMGDLWFEEAPYKVYTAKVSGTPSLKYIPFIVDGQRVYKGEGTVQFVAYWPYAHTPDKVAVWDETTSTYDKFEGKSLASYTSFTNKDDWSNASGLSLATAGKSMGENPGQLPATFIYKHPVKLMNNGSISNYYKIKIGNSISGFSGAAIIIELPAKKVYNELTWDSKTGLVKAKIGTSTIPTLIPVTGDVCASIPMNGVNMIEVLSVEKGLYNEFVEKDPLYKVTISYNNNNEEDNRQWLKYNGVNWWNVSGTNAPSLTYHYWYY